MKYEPYSKDELEKARTARHLLEDPGPEVVGRLLATIDEMNRKRKVEYEGMVHEINAGSVLLPTTPEDKAWNLGRNAALQVVRRYENGEGLFQIADAEPETVEPIPEAHEDDDADR